MPSPFTVPGNWYRGALHVHTTESDGSMLPERVLTHYQMGGWDFVALTDHEKITDRSAASRPDFLVLPGTEVAAGTAELGQRYHIVGIGAEGEVKLPHGRTAQDAIDWIGQAGGVAIIAHPYWSGLTVADLLALRGYAAIEVFNTGCEGEIARGLSSVHWDELLTRGLEVRAVAADDSHWPGFDSLIAWTMVRATDLTRDSVLDALREGRFYASNGPEIRDVVVDLATGRIEVECSPAVAISLVASPTLGGRVGVGRHEPPVLARRRRGPQNWEGLDEGGSLTGATFYLRGQETYARVQVVDARGRTAWTNSLFIRE